MLSKTDFVKGNFCIPKRLRKPFSIQMVLLCAKSWRQAEPSALLGVRFERSRSQNQGNADLRKRHPVLIAQPF
jgi:hypothetical protein